MFQSRVGYTKGGALMQSEFLPFLASTTMPIGTHRAAAGDPLQFVGTGLPPEDGLPPLVTYYKVAEQYTAHAAIWTLRHDAFWQPYYVTP